MRAGWRRRIRFWSDPAREIDAELEFHLASKAAELEAAGVPPAEARRRAERAFGDRARIARELRELARRRQRRRRRADWLDEVAIDLRGAARSLARRPGVPVVVVVLLSLAIGAGTAVFGLFRAVVLEPVSVPAAESVLVLREAPEGEATGAPFSYPLLGALRAQARTAAVAGYARQSVSLHAGGVAERVGAELVTGNYFGVLGLRPRLGRWLDAQDEGAPGSSPHVVIGERLWRRVFGASPQALGERIEVNGHALTVVGVAPGGFRGLELAEPVDLWLPITMIGTIDNGGLYSAPNVLGTWALQWVTGVARVRAGTTLEQARSELATLHRNATAAAPELPAHFGPRPPASLLALRLPTAVVESRAELVRFLAALGAMVSALLLLACINAANLLLLRSRQRASELALRAALGARGGRIARQMLLEGLALGAAAAGLGIAVAWLGTRALSGFGLPGRVDIAELGLGIDAAVLAFGCATALVCLAAASLLPALAGARTDPAAALRRQLPGGRTHGLRVGPALVAVQVALSLVLLVAGLLFARSLQTALRVELGFEPAGAAAAAVSLRQNGYSPERAVVFVGRVMEELAAQSDVDVASAATHVPIEPGGPRLPVRAADASAGGERRSAYVNTVAPGYFEALGIRMLGGRGFEPSDRAGAPAVAVVTEDMARLLWPGQDAVGKRIHVMPPVGPEAVVAGVAADGRYRSISEPDPFVYLPLAQAPNLGVMSRVQFLARGRDAEGMRARIAAAVRAVDPTLPSFDDRALPRQVDAVLMPQRFGTLLLSVFGIVALLISAAGIYAVAAFETASRRRELGIRAALGASAGRLVRAVLLRSGAAVATGAAAGLLLAHAASGLIESFLFGITPGEPVAYVAAALLLAVAAALASWLPARRAAAVEPLEVIRDG